MWVEIFSIGAATAAVVLVTNYWCNWIYILRKTWRRDLRALVRFSRLNYLLWLWERQKKTIPKAFAELVKKHPGKVAFYFEDEVWTYADVDAFSNKIANYFLSKGFKKDDSVSLLLENRPEYLCIWLGLAKIGVVTALINTNLVNDPLVHSIKVSKSKAIIYGEAFSEVVNNVKEKLDDIELYQFNNVESKSGILEGAVELRGNLKNSSEVNVAPLVQKGDPKDNLIYIYTSGTTGLPKAAVIKNLRCIYMVLGIQVMVNFHPDDIVYDALPLYHSAGGMIGAGQTIICGNSTVIRKKFSATNFWKDCAKYKCTVAVYVGELCRYVLAAHDKEEPVKHNVRAIYGNGLKPAIWKQFVEKCKIPEVYELYGATEGNANLISVDSTPGSCGFVPRYGAFLYPITLVRYDESTGEPHRNSKGFCESCKPGEAGILIGKINPKKALHDFTGYADKKASEKKLLFDVFRKGDSYFNSGDVLVQDELGYFYFKDRIGDTFRWKGENVATTEVEAVISNLIELTDAVVYGVEVPGTEGRAGMAALVDINKTLDLEKLAAGFKSNLPAYSIPLFLRVMDTVPLTGTFKLKKRDLQVDGYDVEKVKDDLYFYNARLGKYEKLTKELYHDIVNGKVKV